MGTFRGRAEVETVVYSESRPKLSMRKNVDRLDIEKAQSMRLALRAKIWGGLFKVNVL